MESLTDQDFLRGIATLGVFIGFIGICIWAYLPSRKQELQDAANLPFSDEIETTKKAEVGHE